MNSVVHVYLNNYTPVNITSSQGRCRSKAHRIKTIIFKGTDGLQSQLHPITPYAMEKINHTSDFSLEIDNPLHRFVSERSEKSNVTELTSGELTTNTNHATSASRFDACFPTYILK